MLLLVDTNEATQSPHVVQRLRKFYPKLEVTTLDCGDMKVILEGGDVLAIERKRAGDFIASIGDGRLFDQVERMAKSSKWSCIVIEGTIGYDKDDMAVIPVYDDEGNIKAAEVTGWRGVSVRGAMYAVQWAGCPIISIEPRSLPYIINDLAKFCEKPTEHTQKLGRKRIVTFPPTTLAEEIISVFPGVGLKRSRALLEFAKTQNDTNTGTIAEALTWVSALHKIKRQFRPDGWGDMTVKNVRVALGLQEWEEFDIKIDEEVLKRCDPELYKKYMKEKKNGSR